MHAKKFFCTVVFSLIQLLSTEQLQAVTWSIIVGKSTLLFACSCWEILEVIYMCQIQQKMPNSFNDLQGYNWNEELLQFCMVGNKSWLYLEKIIISYYGNHLGGHWSDSDEKSWWVGSGKYQFLNFSKLRNNCVLFTLVVWAAFSFGLDICQWCLLSFLCLYIWKGRFARSYIT